MPDHAPDCEHLTLDEHDGLAEVTIDRPHVFNTLHVETLTELNQAFDWLRQRPDLRAVILRGGGGTAFAAGADIQELSELDGLSAVVFAQHGQRLCRLIETGSQIVIAAIEGYCLGGGLDLAMACHLRYASPRSTFAHPGARIGILTGFGGTHRLPRLIGKARSLELFLTGRRLTALEAHAWGLIHRVIETPVEAAKETVRKLISS